MSRHLLFEEWDPRGRGIGKGCWLALADESVSMFGFGAAERGAGRIHVQPTVNGAPVDAALSATPAMAELTAAGGSLRFAIDGPALLLEGEGLGLRLHVNVGPGEVVRRTDTGCILSLGATRYIIEMKKGRCDVAVTWNLSALSSNDPELTLIPEDGKLEAVFWDCDPTCRKGEAVDSVSAAAEKAARGFAAFRGSLRGANELYAYVLWLNLMDLRGQTVVVNNKLGDVHALARNMSLASLAFRDAAPALDLVLAQLRQMTKGGLVPAQIDLKAIVPEAAVPMWGFALRCADWSGVPAETLAECDDLLRKAVAWWERERQTDKGEFYYAYTHESGWPHAALLPGADAVVAPDLAAWMAANYAVLADLAERLGKPDAGALRQKAAAQVDLLRELWNGEDYICRSVVKKTAVPCTAALSVETLALGDLLPWEIGAVLRRKSAAPAARLMTALLAYLQGAGARKPAAEAADAGSAAFYDPTLCAVLLALEGGEER